MMMMMATPTKASIIIVGIFLLVSANSCSGLLHENRIHAHFNSYCPLKLQSGIFYECGEPAGRCLCKDHTAYCDISSPALPVLPDRVYILDLCHDYFWYQHPEISFDSVHLSPQYFSYIYSVHLSPQFFSHLNKVTELLIFSHVISPEDFHLLANITAVHINCYFNYNNTEVLETLFGNIISIPNLSTFHSSMCNLSLLSGSHFREQSHIQTFSTYNCLVSINSLDLAAFSSFKDLKRISVTSCNVSHVQPAVLPDLEELNLSGNSLTSFPQTCDMNNSSYFPSLKWISLAFNHIGQIGGNGSTACLPKVTSIDFLQNPIYNIQRGVFNAHNCPILEKIVLQDSTKIPIHTEDFVFANPSIKILNLISVPWNFGDCTPESCVAPNTFANSSLTHLFLGGNDFSQVSSDRFFELFGKLVNLTDLSLANSNFIYDFPYFDQRFCSLNLEYLILSYISVSVCPTFIAKSMINFGVVPAALCNHSSIKVFQADNTARVGNYDIYDQNNEFLLSSESCDNGYKFYLLQYALVGSAVRYISFRSNNVNFGKRCSDIKRYCVLPESFENKPNLEVLLLDGNDFSTVDTERFVSLFGKLTNLKYLSLSECGIQYVSADMFQHFPHLSYLGLDNNKLQALSSQTFVALPMLTVLYLHANSLSVVPEGLFSPDQQRRLEEFTLYDNPLSCSCDNRWLQGWLLSNPDMFDYPEQSYSCADEPSQSVANFTLPDQACMLGKEANIAIIIASTVLITALTGFTLLFRYRWNFRLFLYFALSGRGNARRRRNYVFDVFVSYDQEDFPWIRQQLMPELEDRLGLQLCIHQRDFIPGHYIVTNIAQAVEHSKKVLMVFSRNFVLSRWCQFEMDFCLSHAVENGDSLLIVCLDDVASDEELLTGAMKAALSTMTYIQWVNRPDAVHFFWERVRQSLNGFRFRRRRQRQQEADDPDGMNFRMHMLNL